MLCLLSSESDAYLRRTVRRNLSELGDMEGQGWLFYLCVASGQKLRAFWWYKVGSAHLHCSVVENRVLD